MSMNKLYKMIDKLDHRMEFGYDTKPELVDLLRQMAYHIDDLQSEIERLNERLNEVE